MRLQLTELQMFAMRAVERCGDNEWMALAGAATKSPTEIGRRLVDEISELGDPVEFRPIRGGREFVAAARGISDGLLILAEERPLSPKDWMHVDQERTLLYRKSTTVICLAVESLGQLMECAPNFASWIGGDAWQLRSADHQMSDDHRRRRLADLRSWFGLSDDEVIARAESGRLATEPELVEWLVLLNRGDLV